MELDISKLTLEQQQNLLTIFVEEYDVHYNEQLILLEKMKIVRNKIECIVQNLEILKHDPKRSNS